MKHQDRSIRIIGGKWRGRKVTFPSIDGLRPTGDRIRETLFNWLMNDIRGARGLDLFAGSGALSMEALSRGAAHLTIIEKDRAASENIRHNLNALDADPASYSNINADALTWLDDCTDSFDVVFIDPPFSSGLLTDICQKVAERNVASRFVYLESGERLTAASLPDQWELYREKRAAAVHYSLCIAG